MSYEGQRNVPAWLVRAAMALNAVLVVSGVVLAVWLAATVARSLFRG